MKEKEVQRIVNKKIREHGGFVHKISDFSPEYKPFDFFGVLNGISFYIELKVEKGKSFSLSKIRENQLGAMEKIKNNDRVSIENPLVYGIAIAIVEDGDIENIYFVSASSLFEWMAAGLKSIKTQEIKWACMTLYERLGIPV